MTHLQLSRSNLPQPNHKVFALCRPLTLSPIITTLPMKYTGKWKFAAFGDEGSETAHFNGARLQSPNESTRKEER